jgi:hypothetical protein
MLSAFSLPTPCSGLALAIGQIVELLNVDYRYNARQSPVISNEPSGPMHKRRGYLKCIMRSHMLLASALAR